MGRGVIGAAGDGREGRLYMRRIGGVQTEVVMKRPYRTGVFFSPPGSVWSPTGPLTRAEGKILLP